LGLGLGMNPYGNLSSKHNSWPILLMVYDVPPWLCMKRKYILFSTMILGPKQPRNDINVNLKPLIVDLKMLWKIHVDVFNVYYENNFRLHSILFCRKNKFPIYDDLSTYSVKGHYEYPICKENISYTQLKHMDKRPCHPYCRVKKAFNR